MALYHAVQSFYLNYANFSGRTTRKGFWLGYLWFIGLMFVSFLVPGISFVLGAVLMVVIAVVHTVPMMALASRRYHDAGSSGWVALVPGQSFILYFSPSEFGSNEWGPMVDLRNRPISVTEHY